MKVLALASYPVEAAATRYRLTQFVRPLGAQGIELCVRPFLDSRLFSALYQRAQLPRTVAGLLRSGANRFGDAWRARHYDAVLVQREAMMFGPPVIEWLATRVGRSPLILDLDDATYVAYRSPTYGRWGSAVKWFGKTDDLIRWASVVICGNRRIAEYVAGKGTPTEIIPTVVDTDLFQPASNRPSNPEVPTLGWIGTHSTYPYLESIYPALRRLAGRFKFKLKIVGAGRDEIRLPGVEVENVRWSLDREVTDLQSFDVGLYPVVRDAWSEGKSGFKAIQYMAVGVPYVTTPVGACAEIGEPGVTHFAADGDEAWEAALTTLLSDCEARTRMGEAGRRHSLAHYALPAQCEKLARVLRQAQSK